MQLGSRKVAPVINVTPMIDILLVLLITFMAMPSHTTGLPAEAAQRALDPQPSQPKPLDVILRIGQDRSILIDSQPVVTAQLGARLRLAFAARPGAALFVDGARDLEYADIASVIDVARGAGVGRIGLITDRDHP